MPPVCLHLGPHLISFTVTNNRLFYYYNLKANFHIFNILKISHLTDIIDAL